MTYIGGSQTCRFYPAMTAMLNSMLQAGCFIVLEAHGQNLAAGEMLPMQPMSGRHFSTFSLSN
jgi:hypothetical protein